MAIASENQSRYETLDAMRGVAALLVAVYHIQLSLHLKDVAIPGYLAVDLFFALSGFVIALTYTEKFADNLGVLRFIELRLTRLFPLYALGFLLGLLPLLARMARHGINMGETGSFTCIALFGAVMLPDPCSVHELFPANGPSWSLFFELAINLCFGWCLWRVSVSGLFIVMALAALSFFYLISPPDYYNIGWEWQSFAGGISRTVYSFCAGIALYRLIPLNWRSRSYASLLVIMVMGSLVSDPKLILEKVG